MGGVDTEFGARKKMVGRTSDLRMVHGKRSVSRSDLGTESSPTRDQVSNMSGLG